MVANLLQYRPHSAQKFLAHRLHIISQEALNKGVLLILFAGLAEPTDYFGPDAL
jgi:hypothetical protein